MPTNRRLVALKNMSLLFIAATTLTSCAYTPGKISTTQASPEELESFKQQITAIETAKNEQKIDRSKIQNAGNIVTAVCEDANNSGSIEQQTKCAAALSAFTKATEDKNNLSAREIAYTTIGKDMAKAGGWWSCYIKDLELLCNRIWPAKEKVMIAADHHKKYKLPKGTVQPVILVAEEPTAEAVVPETATPPEVIIAATPAPDTLRATIPMSYWDTLANTSFPSTWPSLKHADTTIGYPIVIASAKTFDENLSLREPFTLNLSADYVPAAVQDYHYINSYASLTQSKKSDVVQLTSKAIASTKEWASEKLDKLATGMPLTMASGIACIAGLTVAVTRNNANTWPLTSPKPVKHRRAPQTTTQETAADTTNITDRKPIRRLSQKKTGFVKRSMLNIWDNKLSFAMGAATGMGTRTLVTFGVKYAVAHFGLAAAITTLPAAATIGMTIASGMALGALAGGASGVVRELFMTPAKQRSEDWKKKAFKKGALFGSLGGTLAASAVESFHHFVPNGAVSDLLYQASGKVGTAYSYAKEMIAKSHLSTVFTQAQDATTERMGNGFSHTVNTMTPIDVPSIDSSFNTTSDPIAEAPHHLSPDVAPQATEMQAAEVQAAAPQVVAPKAEIPQDATQHTTEMQTSSVASTEPANIDTPVSPESDVPPAPELSPAEAQRLVHHYSEEAAKLFKTGDNTAYETLMKGLNIAEQSHIQTPEVEKMYADAAYAEFNAKGGAQKNIQAAVEHAQKAGHAVRDYGSRLLNIVRSSSVLRAAAGMPAP